MSSVTELCTLIYKNVLKTRERLPFFIIGLHIYISQLAFTNYTGSLIWPIIHLVTLGLICMAWELFYSISATKRVNYSCLQQSSFVIFYTLTQYTNLITVSLFSTAGVPLTYLITDYSSTTIVIFVSFLFILNYIFDYIERKFWGEKYWKALLDERDNLEDKIMDDMNKVNFDDLKDNKKNIFLVLPERCINLLEKFCDDIKYMQQSNNHNLNSYKMIHSDQSTADLTRQMAKLFAPIIKSIANRVSIKTDANKDELIAKLTTCITNSATNCLSEFLIELNQKSNV